MSEDARALLGGYMRRGLHGRSKRGAWKDFNCRMAEHGLESVSWDAFQSWYRGATFPLTALRQQLLAAVVHGEDGNAIRHLQAPPFRAYAHGVVMSTTRRKQREFPVVPFRDEAGRTVQKAMIVCCKCGGVAYHLRRGEMDNDHYFEKEGWLVGAAPASDKCPMCRKVVHMKEHKQPAAAAAPVVPQPRTQTGTDRLLVGMQIGENFDEAAGRYRSGWSDVMVAEKLDMPIEWVKAEREHLYPGSNGDNPDADRFIAELTALRDDHGAFDKKAAMLARTAADTETLFKQLHEAQQSLRVEVSHLTDDRDKIRDRMERLLGVAQSIVPNGARRA
jgi:hypothetical protein